MSRGVVIIYDRGGRCKSENHVYSKFAPLGTHVLCFPPRILCTEILPPLTLSVDTISRCPRRAFKFLYTEILPPPFPCTEIFAPLFALPPCR